MCSAQGGGRASGGDRGTDVGLTAFGVVSGGAAHWMGKSGNELDGLSRTRSERIQILVDKVRGGGERWMDSAMLVVGTVFFSGLLFAMLGSASLFRGEIPRSDWRGWHDMFGRREMRRGLILMAVSAPVLVTLLLVR